MTAVAAPAAPPATSPIGGLLWCARLSARQALSGPRKWFMLLAGAVFPGLLAVFVYASKEAMIHPFLQLFDQLYLQGLSLFIALLGAIPAFSSDVEDGTIVYLFSRPAPRPLVVVGKWLGAMIPLVVISIIPVLAAWPLALRQVQDYDLRFLSQEKLPPPEPGKPQEYRMVPRTVHAKSERHPATAKDLEAALLATTLGAVEFGTLFFALGVLFTRPYMIGLAYAVIFEVILGKALDRAPVLSNLIRSATWRWIRPPPRFFQAFIENAPSNTNAWLCLLGVPAVLLAASCVVAANKSYVSRGV